MYAMPTIIEFLENPMGKGSNAIPARAVVKSVLRNRYEILYKSKTKLFTEKVYKAPNGEYYIHVKIPSESKERDNCYDVVIRYTLPDDESGLYKNTKTMNDFPLQFFSNSPSFTYTYAYAFNQYGFLIKELIDKYEDTVIETAPSTRNPSEIISYEKSITFALFHIMDARLNIREVLDAKAVPLDFEKLIKSVKTTDGVRLDIAKAKREGRKASSIMADIMAAKKNDGRKKTITTRAEETRIAEKKTAKKTVGAKQKPAPKKKIAPKAKR